MGSGAARVLIVGQGDGRRLLATRLDQHRVATARWGHEVPGTEGVPEAGLWVLPLVLPEPDRSRPAAWEQLLPRLGPDTLVLASPSAPRAFLSKRPWVSIPDSPSVRVRLHSMALEAFTRDLLGRRNEPAARTTILLAGLSEVGAPMARLLGLLRCRTIVYSENEFEQQMARLQGYEVAATRDSIPCEQVSAAILSSRYTAVEALCRQAGVPLILSAWNSFEGHDLMTASDGYRRRQERHYEDLFPSAWCEAVLPLVLEALDEAVRIQPAGVCR